MARAVPLRGPRLLVRRGSAFFVRCHSLYDFFHAPFTCLVSKRKTSESIYYNRNLNGCFMTKQRLHRFKSITTLGGYATTACGIVLSYATGGSLAAAGLSTFGLLLTCGGYWISDAIARHQAAERAADERRLADMDRRIEDVASKPATWI